MSEITRFDGSKFYKAIDHLETATAYIKSSEDLINSYKNNYVDRRVRDVANALLTQSLATSTIVRMDVQKVTGDFESGYKVMSDFQNSDINNFTGATAYTTDIARLDALVANNAEVAEGETDDSETGAVEVQDGSGSWLVSLWNGFKNAIKKTFATMVNAFVAVIQGILSAIEAVIDAVILVGGLAGGLICSALNFFGANIDMDAYKNGLMNIVGFDAIGKLRGWFDSTGAGKWMNENSWIAGSFFERLVVSSGKWAAIVATGAVITVFTGGIATGPYIMAIAGAVGVGEGAQSAWSNGGSFGEGILAALINGGLNAGMGYLFGRGITISSGAAASGAEGAMSSCTSLVPTSAGALVPVGAPYVGAAGSAVESAMMSVMFPGLFPKLALYGADALKSQILDGNKTTEPELENPNPVQQPDTNPSQNNPIIDENQLPTDNGQMDNQGVVDETPSQTGGQTSSSSGGGGGGSVSRPSSSGSAGGVAAGAAGAAGIGSQDKDDTNSDEEKKDDVPTEEIPSEEDNKDDLIHSDTTGWDRYQEALEERVSDMYKNDPEALKQQLRDYGYTEEQVEKIMSDERIAKEAVFREEHANRIEQMIDIHDKYQNNKEALIEQLKGYDYTDSEIEVIMKDEKLVREAVTNGELRENFNIDEETFDRVIEINDMYYNDPDALKDLLKSYDFSDREIEHLLEDREMMQEAILAYEDRKKFEDLLENVEVPNEPAPPEEMVGSQVNEDGSVTYYESGEQSEGKTLEELLAEDGFTLKDNSESNNQMPEQSNPGNGTTSESGNTTTDTNQDTGGGHSHFGVDENGNMVFS